MHKISIPCTYLSSSSTLKTVEGETRSYYFLNVLAEDNNVDRFFIPSSVYEFCRALVLGDKISLNCHLFFMPDSRSWNVKVDNISS